MKIPKTSALLRPVALFTKFSRRTVLGPKTDKDLFSPLFSKKNVFLNLSNRLSQFFFFFMVNSNYFKQKGKSYIKIREDICQVVTGDPLIRLISGKLVSSYVPFHDI